MSKGTIKVKAMALFLADGRMLVTDCFDKVTQKPFYRMLGGHIEFGERSEETLKREMIEEVGADVEVLALLDIVQNHFFYEGRRYHEIVFIHHTKFLDENYNRREDLRNLEVDFEELFKWVPVTQALNGDIPLFPVADYERLLIKIGAAL
jgi:8-oxo-dGTP pyrophosphatase MutT (NUDIX family)